MRLLVTGGAGFIGSNFIRYILSEYPEYIVTNLDKLTYPGNLNNLKDVKTNPNYFFIKGDICNKKTVEKVVKDVDVILNFAAETHVDRAIISAGSFIKTDVFGTYCLLEASRKYDIQQFIQISTDEVYGSIDKGSFVEEDTLNPRNPYSASKAGGDLLVSSFHSTYGLPTTIVRSSNNFGPYQHLEKFIPLLITNALMNKRLPLYGDGLNRREWLYVTDNCEAISVILHKGKIGEIYNVGGGNEKTNLEVARTILRMLKKPESLIEYVRDRPGHDTRYSVDCTKIEKLSWKPLSNFTHALKYTVDWYQKNEWWWKPLIKKE
jgi:dTDP-glucose 4,6-dehydratase